jgi:hypothetical protein
MSIPANLSLARNHNFLKIEVCSNIRGTQTAFAEKHWLFLGPMNWLMAGEKHGTCPPFCICLCSKPFSLQSLCNHLGFQEDRFLTSSWQGTETTPSNRPPAWLQITTLEPLPEQGLSAWSIRTHLWLGLLNYAYLGPLSPVLCLLKPIAHVCILKMAEDGLSAYSASSHSMFWTV